MVQGELLDAARRQLIHALMAAEQDLQRQLTAADQALMDAEAAVIACRAHKRSIVDQIGQCVNEMLATAKLGGIELSQLKPNRKAAPVAGEECPIPGCDKVARHRGRHTNQVRPKPESPPPAAAEPEPVDPPPTELDPGEASDPAPAESLLAQQAPTPEWTTTGHLAYWCDSCLDEGHTIGFSRSMTLLDHVRIVHDRIALNRPERRARTDADAEVA